MYIKGQEIGLYTMKQQNSKIMIMILKVLYGAGDNFSDYSYLPFQHSFMSLNQVLTQSRDRWRIRTNR